MNMNPTIGDWFNIQQKDVWGNACVLKILVQICSKVWTKPKNKNNFSSVIELILSKKVSGGQHVFAQ